MSKEMDKRLTALEQSQLDAEFARIEAMSKDELEAFLEEDPPTAAVLRTLTEAQLSALTRSEPAAVALFYERLNALSGTHG